MHQPTQEPVSTEVVPDTQPVIQLLTGNDFCVQLQKSVQMPIAIRIQDVPNQHHWFSMQFSTMWYKGEYVFTPTDSAVRHILAECTTMYNTMFPDADNITPIVVYGFKETPSYSETDTALKPFTAHLDEDQVEDVTNRYNWMMETRGALRIGYSTMDELMYHDPSVFKLVSDQHCEHIAYTLDDLIIICEHLTVLRPVKSGDGDFIRAVLSVVMGSAGIFSRNSNPSANEAVGQYFQRLISKIGVAEKELGTYNSTSLMRINTSSKWLNDFYNRAVEVIRDSSNALVFNTEEGGYNLGFNPPPPLWVTVKDLSGDTISGKLSEIVRHESMFGVYFSVQVTRLSATAGDLREFNDTVYAGDIKEFTIRDLVVTQDAIDIGKRVLSMLNKENVISSVDYRGLVKVPGFFGPVEVHTSGTIIHDPAGCRETDYSTFKGLTSGQVNTLDADDVIKVKDVEDNAYAIATISTKMVGFSLDKRRWVQYDLTKSQPVQYDKTIIEKLVLPDQEKQNIRAIVENLNTGFVDIVSGKGGGAIFLLFGAPGLGKTLTAEAISAVSERPLYKLSVGELGTNVEQLERSLERALDYATRWDATLLFDEADIFLEARDSNNIERNAMVGVFLRLLEYYQGIMFLTTNRVKNFDPAFFSRIVYSIEFKEQSHTDRVKVWTNLLSAAKLTNLTPDQIHKLAESNVNNRQIKTCITNAQRFAMAEKVPVSADHVSRSLESIVNFNLQVTGGH